MCHQHYRQGRQGINTQGAHAFERGTSIKDRVSKSQAAPRVGRLLARVEDHAQARSKETMRYC